MLGHDDVGPEGGGESASRRSATASSQAPSPVPAGRAMLTSVPAAAPSPISSTAPVPGNSVPAGLVDGDRQHARIVPVDRLDAVAVVHVEVDVQDAQSGAACPRDRECRVVVDAEPRGTGRHRVMEPAARVEGVLVVAAQDRLHRPDRPAGHRRPRLVHAGERRVVAALADARQRAAERRRRRTAARPRCSAGRGTTRARRPARAPAPGPARPRRRRAGRSPARTDAASADGPDRSRRSTERGP